MDIYSKIRPRRGTETEWNTANPILLEGEIGLEFKDDSTSDFFKVKVGNGIDNWNDLPYALNAEAARSMYGGTVTDSCDIYLRSGTTEEWEEEDPVLGLGEIVFDKTKANIKIGDGVHTFSQLIYITENIAEITFDFGDEDAT